MFELTSNHLSNECQSWFSDFQDQNMFMLTKCDQTTTSTDASSAISSKCKKSWAGESAQLVSSLFLTSKTCFVASLIFAMRALQRPLLNAARLRCWPRFVGHLTVARPRRHGVGARHLNGLTGLPGVKTILEENVADSVSVVATQTFFTYFYPETLGKSWSNLDDFAHIFPLGGTIQPPPDRCFYGPAPRFFMMIWWIGVSMIDWWEVRFVTFPIGKSRVYRIHIYIYVYIWLWDECWSCGRYHEGISVEIIEVWDLFWMILNGEKLREIFIRSILTDSIFGVPYGRHFK